MILQFCLQIGDLLQGGADSWVIVIAPESPPFVASLRGVFVQLREEIGVDVADAGKDGLEGVADERGRDGREERREGEEILLEAGEGRRDRDEVQDGT